MAKSRLTAYRFAHRIAFIDGRVSLEDDTFKNVGKVGLWTKADNMMLFDDSNSAK